MIGRAWPGVLGLYLLSILAGVPTASAERLPIQAYGPAEGLPSTYVLHVMHDSRGFVWFSTRDGLSRFDGLRFVTYGTEDGLPDPTINAMLQRRDGTYWIATNGGGVCQFDPQATGSRRPLFRVYRVGSTARDNRVNMLFEDHAGQLWAGTDGGLFRLHNTGHGWVFMDVPLGIDPPVPTQGLEIDSMAESADGMLWIGTLRGLIRLSPDGRRTHFPLLPGTVGDAVLALKVDAHGLLWIGHQTGLIVLQPFADTDGTHTGSIAVRPLVRASHPTRLPFEDVVSMPTHPGESRWFTLNATLPRDRLLALLPMADGHVWLGTSRGLMEFDGARFHRYSRSQGLSDFVVTSLAADGDGNVWAATVAAGAMKLTRRGFHSYDESDGLGDPRVQAIFEDRHGAIVCVSGNWIVNRFDGRGRFTHAQPRIATDWLPHWGSQVGFLDSEDRWWLMAHRGLLRLPRGARPEDVDRRPAAQVIGDLEASQLYEDRHGDIWIALRTQARIALWQRHTGTVRLFTSEDGLPDISVSAITEDAAGNIWLGSRSRRSGALQGFALHARHDARRRELRPHHHALRR